MLRPMRSDTPIALAEPAMGPEPDPAAVHRPAWSVNRVMAGDCLERLDEVPDRSVHLVLCDLPYGTTQNPWDSVIPLDRLWQAYRRVLTPSGAVVLTGQGPFTARLILSNESWFKYKLAWIKSKPTNFLNARKQPLRRHEDICVFYGKQPVYRPQMQPGAGYDKGIRKDQLTGSYGDFDPVHVRSIGGRYPSDVVYFKTAESEGTVWHPTQKPLALGRYLVRTFSDPGQVVLDNAAGSGTFLVAALCEGRNFVGIERNDDGPAAGGSMQFKRVPVDLLAVSRARLAAAWRDLPDRQRRWVARAGELAAW